MARRRLPLRNVRAFVPAARRVATTRAGAHLTAGAHRPPRRPTAAEAAPLVTREMIVANK